ncbi:MAG: hypothetical protein EBR40_10890, partial [Proteobacteria bacterium]|nr:hypothetical protein [Pseudomonadota bacterium]
KIVKKTYEQSRHKLCRYEKEKLSYYAVGIVILQKNGKKILDNYNYVQMLKRQLYMLELKKLHLFKGATA